MQADRTSGVASTGARPNYAPENRSAGAGKFIAVAVFALLVLGALATLVVVMTRGRTQFANPDAGLARPPAEVAAPATEAPATEAPTNEATKAETPEAQPSVDGAAR
jgi:hypothetical protein